ncbi:WD repeat-containing protein 3, partial [Aphelenchoides avenae]
KRLSIRIERMLELPDEALCCAISPNGKFIVFGLLDNTARVYYLDSLKFFVSLYGHSLPVTCVDVGPDNKLVVTGSADKSVKIWGLDFGDCHKSLFAHDDVVTCVKFNPGEEEKLFWSAGKDGKVRQWDAVKFDRIQTLNGHSAEVRALTRTADGNTMISASHDKSIRLWELSDEIIVLQEQEELEREKEAEERLLDAEDIVRNIDFSRVCLTIMFRSPEKQAATRRRTWPRKRASRRSNRPRTSSKPSTSSGQKYSRPQMTQ